MISRDATLALVKATLAMSCAPKYLNPEDAKYDASVGEAAHALAQLQDLVTHGSLPDTVVVAKFIVELEATNMT